jgi:GNAT superfamily N-acetyltransferase
LIFQVVMNFDFVVYRETLPEAITLEAIISLLPKNIHHLLSTKFFRSLHTTVAVAYLQDQIVGLALATCFPLTCIGHIHYLVVDPDVRRKGIATQLLTAIKTVLLDYECRCVTIDFLKQEIAAAAFLRSRGAEGSHLRLLRCRAHIAQFSPPWLAYFLRLPGQLSLFPWSELQQLERRAIQQLVQGGALPATLSPLNQQDKIAYCNSLGIRSNTGQIAAWIVTHYTNDARDEISYSSFFVDRAYRNLSLSTYLLAESIRRQKNAQVPKLCCEVNCELTSSRWRLFVQRRLVPYATEVDHVWQAYFPL